MQCVLDVFVCIWCRVFMILCVFWQVVSAFQCVLRVLSVVVRWLCLCSYSVCMVVREGILLVWLFLVRKQGVWVVGLVLGLGVQVEGVGGGMKGRYVWFVFWWCVLICSSFLVLVQFCSSFFEVGELLYMVDVLRKEVSLFICCCGCVEDMLLKRVFWVLVLQVVEEWQKGRQVGFVVSEVLVVGSCWERGYRLVWGLGYFCKDIRSFIVFVSVQFCYLLLV